jgi:hypothetical protein
MKRVYKSSVGKFDNIYYYKCHVCGKYFIARGVVYLAYDRVRHIQNCKGVISQWF